MTRGDRHGVDEVLVAVDEEHADVVFVDGVADVVEYLLGAGRRHQRYAVQTWLPRTDAAAADAAAASGVRLTVTLDDLMERLRPDFEVFLGRLEHSRDVLRFDGIASCSGAATAVPSVDDAAAASRWRCHDGGKIRGRRQDREEELIAPDVAGREPVMSRPSEAG